MKALFTGISLAFVISFSSCYIQDNGPIGPIGPQGLQGAPGESGFVFEWENVNFTAPDYDVVLAYPNNFEPLNSDVALVYLLWDIQEIDGEDVEIWRALPQTLLTSDGLLQYNYDFTKYDVRLFLDAEFSLDLLTAIDTDEWVVRVVVVPGDFWSASGRIDTSNYYEVAEALGLPKLSKHKSIVERR